MKALTLWPEWAWAIEHLGKRVENRIWVPSPGQLKPGDWLAIHAGAHIGGRKGIPAMRKAAVRLANTANDAGCWTSLQPLDLIASRGPAGRPFRLSNCTTGAIVAVAEYLGHDADRKTPWDGRGAHHWRLGRVGVLQLPVYLKGARNLWSVPAELLPKLEAAKARAS